MQPLLDKSGYLSEETIAAIATQTGGAIAMIRVSGKKAFASLNALTRSQSASEAEPRKLVRATLYDELGTPIDDALFVRFVNPSSYTGEDCVEYHLHGSSFIAHQLIESLCQLGVRQALPGEFSFRAVKNGKMTLFQAEAIADLISASNDGAVSLALEKMSGAQNQFLNSIAQGLRHTAVLSEAGIDFADQDIEEVSLPSLRNRLISIVTQLNALKESYHRGIKVQEGIRVAFIGLPNAGKSSFFNALLGEDRSIVSDWAGTTRDVVREKLTLRGKEKNLTLRLEDTAGLRITQNPIEKMGIDRTHQAVKDADLVLFIVDATTVSWDAVKEQWTSLEGLTPLKDQMKAKTLGIFTKRDQLEPSTFSSLLQKTATLGIPTWAFTSALSGEGISEAVEKIIRFCEKWTVRGSGELVLTRLDHVRQVSETLDHLERALSAPEIDLFASDLKQALHSLGPLIGETPPDDILNKIFSDFCIGK